MTRTCRKTWFRMSGTEHYVFGFWLRVRTKHDAPVRWPIRSWKVVSWLSLVTDFKNLSFVTRTCRKSWFRMSGTIFHECRKLVPDIRNQSPGVSGTVRNIHSLCFGCFATLGHPGNVIPDVRDQKLEIEPGSRTSEIRFSGMSGHWNTDFWNQRPKISQDTTSQDWIDSLVGVSRGLLCGWLRLSVL